MPRGKKPPPTSLLMRIEIILNPAAGPRGVRLAEDIMDVLRAAHHLVRLRGTRRRGDAEGLAREAVAQDVDRLVVAGGDGTIGEAVNGLAGAPLPLAVIPTGTANVLAHEVGLPRGVRDLAQIIVDGEPTRIAPGIVNGRRFVMMSSVGLDAEVVDQIDPDAKRRFGKWAYVGTGLSRLMVRRPVRYGVEIDGAAHDAGAVIVAKGRCYGGGFVVAPRADLGAPSFDVVLARRGDRRGLLCYAAALPVGLLPRWRGIETIRAERVAITGPHGAPVQADGDIIATLPARIEVASEPVTLMTPRRRRAA